LCDAGVDTVSVLPSIDALGGQVLRRWSAAEFDEAALPEIACEELRSARLHEQLTRADLIRCALETDRLPPQADLEARFGEPPLTLYVGPRFRIEALFWLDGTTSIHQHGFSGAFSVLEGSSIHSRYTFSPRVRAGQRASVGDLQLVDANLLRRGDTHPIAGGAGLIHGLFHLDRPSVTLVVRSLTDPASRPQYRYLYPHVAIDGEAQDETATRQRQLLEMVATVDLDAYEAHLRALLGRVDYVSAVLLLERAARHFREPPRLTSLVGAMRPRHKELVDALPPVLEHILRTDEVVSLREAVHDWDGRFLLALLLNVPTRQALLDAVARAFPDADPVDRVIEWLRPLAFTQPGEPLLLGFEVDEVTWLALEQSVRGRAFESFLDELKASYSAEQIAEQTPALEELWHDLRSVRLLRPLLI
jgi:hypothetical protein